MLHLKRLLTITVGAGALLALASGGAQAAPQTTDSKPQTVNIAVNGRVSLELDANSINMSGDPFTSFESAVTTLTVKSNYRTPVTVSVQATAPTSGPETIPVNSFQYQLGNDQAVAFTGASQNVTAVNRGQTALAIKYLVAGGDYAEGNYASTVTYTVTANP